MVTKTEVMQAVATTRRQVRILPPHLDILCQVAELVVAKAGYDALPKGEGAGDTPPKPGSFNKVEWQRNYMRDYRAGRRRRKVADSFPPRS